jgi:hypothetical protein
MGGCNGKFIKKKKKLILFKKFKFSLFILFIN